MTEAIESWSAWGALQRGEVLALADPQGMGRVQVVSSVLIGGLPAAVLGNIVIGLPTVIIGG